MATENTHPLAPDHLPPYVVAADGSDVLFTIMVVMTLALVLGVGLLYLKLHAIPEHMAHENNHSQMQVVGILALLALFTHNNLFWVIAVLLAAFRPPDVMTPINSIARSLAVMAGRAGAPLDNGRPAHVAQTPDSHASASKEG